MPAAQNIRSHVLCWGKSTDLWSAGRLVAFMFGLAGEPIRDVPTVIPSSETLRFTACGWPTQSSAISFLVLTITSVIVKLHRLYGLTSWWAWWLRVVKSWSLRSQYTIYRKPAFLPGVATQDGSWGQRSLFHHRAAHLQSNVLPSRPWARSALVAAAAHNNVVGLLRPRAVEGDEAPFQHAWCWEAT